MIRLTIAALTAAAIAAPALAAPQIKDNPEIFHRLLTSAIAHEIFDKCERIEVRKLAATFYVLGIVSYAKKQGFTSDQIDAYRKTESEQERLRAATYAYLDEHGVDRADPQSYCPLGQAEIEQDSQIGKLLKAR